jgi:hypothetical protein
MRSRIAAVLLLVFAVPFLAGCGDSDSSTEPGFGSVRVSMTDAPAQYDEVNIVIREVHVHQDGEGEEQGWVVVRPDSESTYDLLELRNGVFVTLGFEDVVPSGHYDQVRLILGDGSTVVVDGVTHPLVTPSALQSGIKVNGGFDVPDDGLVEVMLDFDASRSIHVTGNGTYMLQPVIRMMQSNMAGAIHGDLDPVTDAQVHAIFGPDSISTIPNEDGEFTLSALPAGVYDVAVDVAAGYRDTTLSGVVVARGLTTELGVITLSPVSTSTPQ